MLKLSKVATFSFVQRQVWHLRGRRPCVDNSLLHKVESDHAYYNASHSTHSYRGKCSHSQYSYAFRYRQCLLPFPLWLHYPLPFQRQRWIVRVRDGSVFALDHRRSSRFSENNSNRIAPATDGVTDTRSRKLYFMLWNWGSTRRRGSGFITDSTRFGRLCCQRGSINRIFWSFWRYIDFASPSISETRVLIVRTYSRRQPTFRTAYLEQLERYLCLCMTDQRCQWQSGFGIVRPRSILVWMWRGDDGSPPRIWSCIWPEITLWI